MAYQIASGPIPAGLLILHSCDNPPCCNPRHLSAGTNAENLADSARKGRMHEKVSAEVVRAIRRRRAVGEPVQALAREFGISLHTVRQYVSGQKRPHVLWLLLIISSWSPRSLDLDSMTP